MTTRPWKHPKTGVYHLQRAVPPDLRALIGKREEKVSLGVKDPERAKRLHAAALAELEERWANLRVGSKTLSEREAHELAAPLHAWWIDQHRDEFSAHTFWRLDLGDKLWPRRPPGWSSRPDLGAVLLREAADPASLAKAEMEAWCLDQAQALLDQPEPQLAASFPHGGDGGRDREQRHRRDLWLVGEKRGGTLRKRLPQGARGRLPRIDIWDGQSLD